MKTKFPVRVAVIGAGATSQKVHLPALKELAGEGLVSLAVLCDINRAVAAKAAGEFGFGAYEHDAEKVFGRGDVDAVYIFGTARMHYEYAKKALSTGKHVFVEKPPSIDSAHALEIARMAEEKSRAVMVGFNRRFQEGIAKAKESLRAESVLYSMEAVFDKSSLLKAPPYGGSTWLSANAIHSIDVLHFVAGALPTDLWSVYNIAAGDTPQNFSALLRWKDGTHAILRSNNSAGRQAEEYVFHGAGVSYAVTGRVVERCTGDTCVPLEASPSRGFLEEHRHFAHYLAGKEHELKSSMRDGAAALYLAELIERGHKGPIDWRAFEKSATPVEVPQRGTSGAILILNPGAIASFLPRIATSHELVYEEQLPSLSESEKKKVIAIITGRGGGPVTTGMLDALPSLKVIGVVGASLKKYEVGEALGRGIPILNASDTYAEAVAEFTLMLMIVGLRGASRSHEVMRKGGWGLSLGRGVKATLRAFRDKARTNTLLSALAPALRPLWGIVKKAGGVDAEPPKVRGGNRNLKGATVGLVGFGEISKKVIEYLGPLHPTIKVYSEYFTEEEARRLGVHKAELDEVLRSDIVSLHRGLSPRTKGSFGRREINALRPGAVLVNTARGELLDTAALVARLRRGDLFACLDVFDEEPLSKKSPLRAMPNVFLTSHISGSTSQMYAESAASLSEKVLRYLGGEKIEAITSEEQLKNMT